jgi:hypothetical protein
MTTDPKDCIATQSSRGHFRPFLVISRETDGLTAYFKFDSDYSQRLTDHVTLYRSTGSDEIIGCRIRGISRILEELPNFLHVNHQDAKLAMVFWSFCGDLDDDELRGAFRELAKAAGDLPLQTV